MKTKFKLCALIFALLCMAIIFMPNEVFAAEVKNVANLAELQAALADANVSEVNLTATIAIEDDVTINGNNKTITTAEAKAFELHTGIVELKNMSIINSATNGRCIDVRDGDVALTLDNVNLKTTSKSHNQPLTIGSTFSQIVPINLKNTTIEAGPDGWGYAVIIFNPVNLSIENSNITGYTSLYFKSEAEGGTGTTESTVTVNGSTLTGKYELNTDEPSNSFATIVFNDSGINVDINNSNLYAKGSIQKVIGEYAGMEITEKHNKVTISGNTVISTQRFIAGMKDSDATVILNEGVTSNIEIPEELLPAGAEARLENDVYVVYVPHDVVINGTENGTVTVDKASALEGETVTLTVTPNTGYELSKLTVNRKEVVDVKFTMPNEEVTVIAEFEKIPEPVQPSPEPEEPTEPEVDYVFPGISETESETVKETINSSIKEYEDLAEKVETAIQNGEKVTISVNVSELEKDNIRDEDKQMILQEVKANQKVHQYIDISVAVKTEKETLGYLPQLTEKIKLSVEISKDLIVEGRKFFILKLHDGEVYPIEATLNGTKLEFETDQFSLFALAYEDVETSGSVPGEQQPTTEEKDDTPKTGVINIPVYVWLTIAGMAVVGIVTTKKSSKHSK